MGTKFPEVIDGAERAAKIDGEGARQLVSQADRAGPNAWPIMSTAPDVAIRRRCV
jgi:hypothetical protein